MADPTGEEQALAAELDELLNKSRGRSASTKPAPDPDINANGESPPTIEQEIDRALDDAQGNIDRVASGANAESTQIDPATIEELDEHLADSTPEDLDIRAEQEFAQAREALSEARTHSAAQEIAPAPAPETPAPIDHAPPETPVEDAAPTEEATTSAPEMPTGAPVEAAETVTENPAPTSAAPSISAPAPELAPSEAPDSDKADTTEEIFVGSPADASDAGAQPRQAPTAKAALAMLRTINAPLVLLSPNGRDIVGWMALVTAFNALCLWAYLLFVK